jgi:hypothetical protein
MTDDVLTARPARSRSPQTQISDQLGNKKTVIVVVYKSNSYSLASVDPQFGVRSRGFIRSRNFTVFGPLALQKYPVPMKTFTFCTIRNGPAMRPGLPQLGYYCST